MVKRATLCMALQLASALRHASDSAWSAGSPPKLRLMKTSEMVPFCLVGMKNAKPGIFETEPIQVGTKAVLETSGSPAGTGNLRLEAIWDNALAGSLGSGGVEDCTKECESNPDCMGVQWGAVGQKLAACTLRVKFKNFKAADGSCLSDCRAVFQERGFKDVPLVPLDESDGQVYMREDCMDETVALHNNTYYGVPWDWEQPGVSFVRKGGYGASPLLDLVTPEVLHDLVVGGSPPWRTGAKDVVDLNCGESASVWLGIIDALKSTRRNPRAYVVDVGSCICSMLGSGWDPRQDLKTDAVFLMHRDQNYSPASPHTHISVLAERETRVPCVQHHHNSSKFATDVEAFTALADSPHMLGMYFTQTPPISHEKVFLVPLGADRMEWIPHIRPHLQPNSSSRSSSRAALYEVSHNLAIPYRQDVFAAVRANFAPEPLRVRHLPFASGSRAESIALQCMSAVFGQSPIGIGENCFRHSELLLAGTIPVVQASLGVAAMRYFPHLAVSNWHEVTPELLESSYKTIWSRVRSGDYSLEPLTNGFWHKHIRDTASRRPMDPFYAKFPNPPVTCPSWDCVSPQ